MLPRMPTVRKPDETGYLLSNCQLLIAPLGIHTIISLIVVKTSKQTSVRISSPFYLRI